MDGAGQTMFHGRVVHAVIAERHVANDGIKIPIGKWCCFKTLRKYGGVRVEFPGNPGGESVKFNACPVSPVQIFRHETQEMPDSHCWLKHFHTLTKSQVLQSIPDRFNNQRRGEMCIGSCSPG